MNTGTHCVLWAGLVAAIWYPMVVLIGAMATPGYSHIGEHVSTLYQSGAPNGTWIATLFAVYNLLVLAFGLGLVRLATQAGGARWRMGRAGGVALVLTAIAGFMDDVFRQDPIGSPATTSGTLHVVFAGVSSVLTILSIALIARWALARPALRDFGRYSVATLAVIAVSGPVAAVATASMWSTMGLLERIPIFGFVQWAAVSSIILARWQPVPRQATELTATAPMRG
ncbi:MAG: DUF998 domain-containing protein [Acidimicrobiia bacterium]|nr:DUF998 domain-containing protein [Acidimicrobiia bacterium]